jgi:BarA-like signal transduction histidine kinase
MATTTKALFRGAATTTLTTTLYTVPSATTAVVTNIIVTNTAATAATFDLSLNGTKLADTVAIAADSIFALDLKQVINATQTIQGGASATSVNFHISGVEIS